MESCHHFLIFFRHNQIGSSVLSAGHTNEICPSVCRSNIMAMPCVMTSMRNQTLVCRGAFRGKMSDLREHISALLSS